MRDANTVTREHSTNPRNSFPFFSRPDPPFQPMDQADVRAAVQAFLSAFVSETLAARGLYPPSAFAPARVLGACARRARHPGLCAYVDKAAAALTVCVESVLGCEREKREAGRRRGGRVWLWVMGRHTRSCRVAAPCPPRFAHASLPRLLPCPPHAVGWDSRRPVGRREGLQVARRAPTALTWQAARGPRRLGTHSRIVASHACVPRLCVVPPGTRPPLPRYGLPDSSCVHSGGWWGKGRRCGAAR